MSHDNGTDPASAAACGRATAGRHDRLPSAPHHGANGRLVAVLDDIDALIAIIAVNDRHIARLVRALAVKAAP